MEFVDTVIIGGGQAGLASGYHLSQNKHNFIILEQSSQAGNKWRNERWDSFTLVSPNWTFRMPGIELTADDNSFLPRDQIVEFFENYIKEFDLPVKYNSKVTSVEFKDNYFYSKNNGQSIKSKNVIIATGLFHKPRIPEYSSRISPDIIQLHSSQYRNPQSLPPGAVLVAGSGQSGCQISEELYKSGRKVFLCVGRAGRALRKYRGKDIFYWMDKTGFFNRTADQLPPGAGRFEGNPHLSGTNGGHSVNLHQFAKDGVTLLGRLENIEDHKMTFAPDLYQKLETVDQFEAFMKNLVDNYINENNINAAPEEIIELKEGYNQPIITQLNLKSENISTIIWACGYTFDFSFVKLPVFDSDGFPIQDFGITKFPGLYFAGLPWTPYPRFGLFLGVAEGTGIIASDILRRIKATSSEA
jgi:putative flavoprotein involved in K+ transport